MRRQSAAALICASTLTLGLAACGSDDAGDSDGSGGSATASATPHGYVEGAEEATEP